MNRLKQLAHGIDAAILRENDGGGGSGGDGGDDKTEYLTAESAKKLLGELVNGAVTAQLKRLDFGKMIGEQLGTLKEGLVEELKSTLTPEPDPDGGDDKGKGKLAPEVEKMLKDQRAEIDKLKKANDERERKIVEARERERTGNLEKSLESQLIEAGISKGIHLDAALSLLLRQGRVKYEDDESDTLQFKSDDPLKDYVSLGDGVSEWAKSKAGKHFIEASNARGSGNEGGDPDRKGKGGEVSAADVLAHVLGS